MDSGPDDAGVDGDVGPGGPEAALPPALEPCPDGWRFVDGLCHPWAEDERPTCADDEAPIPGQGCVHIGGVCPSDGWPAELPATGVLYVRADAPAGGDGSRAAPYQAVDSAARGASPGTTIAVAAGRYEEAVVLNRGVILRGACAAQTIIAAPTYDGFSGTITARGTDIAIQTLRISGERPGIWADGASVTLTDVIVDGVVYMGMAAIFEGSIAGERVLVRGTRRRDDGQFGYGTTVAENGTLALTTAAYVGNHGEGIAASTASHLTLTDVLVADTEAHAGGRFGEGFAIRDGAEAVLTRTAVEGNRTCGVDVALGARLTATDLFIRGTRPRESDGALGCALGVRDGAAVEISRAALVGNHYYSVGVTGASTLSFTDVVVRGTRADGPQEGIGILIEGGASATLTRTLMEENSELGLLVRGLGTVVTLADVTARSGGNGDQSDEFGAAIQVLGGASIEGRRVLLEGNRYVALSAFDDGSMIVLEDLLITGTRERGCADGACAGFAAGDGMLALGGARVSVTRFLIARSARSGIYVGEGGELDLRDGEVTGNPIGVAVVEATFDVNRITDGVVFTDNERNLAREELPAPEASGLPSF